MAAITMRVAVRSEAQAIVKLVRCAFQGRLPHSRASFASTRDVEHLIAQGVFLVADREGTIIGCAYLVPNREAARLELLAVCPEHQRAGIGSQLLEAAEDLSRTLQCDYMQIRVLNMCLPVLRFCHRRGYIDFAIESLPTESPDQHCHLISMSKQLDKYWHGF